MRTRHLELVADAAMVTVTAVAGVIVGGRALEIIEPRTRGIPVLGNLVTSVKAAWWTVFNP